MTISSPATSFLKLHFNAAALAGAVVTVLLGASAAQAAEVVQDPDGNAIGILGLELEEGFSLPSRGFFDVEFVYGRGIDVIGGVLDLDFFDQDEARLAAEILTSVLNAESTPVTTAGPVPNTSNFFDIPYVLFEESARIVSDVSDGVGSWATGNVGAVVDYLSEDRSWANFTRVGLGTTTTMVLGSTTITALASTTTSTTTTTMPDTGLCAVTFSVSTQPRLLLLGGLRFEVDYSSAPGPGFVGSGAAVACTDLVGAGVDALNDIDAERVLNAAFIDAEGIDTPVDLARCIYDTAGESLASSDLSVTVTDARTPEFEQLAGDVTAEIKCFQCGQPFSDGGRPEVTDCLFILKSATALEICDPDCVCDVNADGDITALDALLCLQDLVFLPVSLVCICDSATTTTTMAPTTTTAPPMGECGDGNVDEGEDCDPGAPGSGECCTNSCTFEGAGTACGDPVDECTDADSCDGAGTCMSGDFKPADTPCGSPEDTDCTNPDSCNGMGQCFARNEPSDTPCNTDPCGDTATCQGSLCTCPATTTLPPTTTTTMVPTTTTTLAPATTTTLAPTTTTMAPTTTSTTATTTSTTLPPTSVCEEQLCLGDETLAQQCTTFLELCLAQAGEEDEDECVLGGLFICEGGACGQDLCANDEGLAQECSTFLGDCLATADTQSDVEECVGAAILKCAGDPLPAEGCQGDLCADDDALAQQCTTFLEACLAAGDRRPCR